MDSCLKSSFKFMFGGGGTITSQKSFLRRLATTNQLSTPRGSHSCKQNCIDSGVAPTTQNIRKQFRNSFFS
jgi:hypothetical protein